uniref:Uncharacterized protein n=1 Tax=Lepeophtheirus salmonis TaxID=72036 RepID=A0A0K2TYD2_LEPSM
MLGKASADKFNFPWGPVLHLYSLWAGVYHSMLEGFFLGRFFHDSIALSSEYNINCNKIVLDIIVLLHNDITHFVFVSL